MIEASKAPELSGQPTKRGRRAWLIALAVMVAAVTIALLANAPKPEPVKVWFVRATNEGGVKKLVFEGTNGMPRQIEYAACVFTGATAHAKAPGYFFPDSIVDFRAAKARERFAFTVGAPPKDVPYYVEWTFYEIGGPATRLKRLRRACCDFLLAHGMRTIADRFFTKPDLHIIPSTEIKE